MSDEAAWSDFSLPEVLDFKEGPGILAKDFRSEGVPLIRLAGLKYGADLLEGCNYLDPDMVTSKWSHFQIAPGDVLLSTSASLGEVAIVGEEAAGAIPYTGIIRFRPRDSELLDSRFIRYVLESPQFKTQVEAMGVGSVMRHFGPSHLKQMTIRIPRALVQGAIVELLASLDVKIAANSRLIKVAEDLAIPLLEGAASAPLADLVEHRRISQNPAECDAGSVAHFSLPAFDERQRPERVGPGEIKSAKFRITAPSVLISKLNPRFPRVWDVMDLPNVPSFASTEFLVLEPKYSSTSVLWAALNQPVVGHQLESMVAGTSGSHQRVKPADILKVQVADPRRLDSAIAERITNLARIVHNAREESETLAALRDTLLPRLMSGELRVKDAEAVIADAV
ncbi:restriction endonuclease subunit S [Rhodococcus ruber]|uniref:restriction endonuclease subunit S n=1 Tax=Rhodococcus ruber TaxID=1830 RepID=UPI003784FB61